MLQEQVGQGETFVNCGKVSYTFTSMLIRGDAFPRVPLKLRLLVAMMEDANTQGEIRSSISKIALGMGPVVGMGRIYQVRNQLWIEDLIRRDGRRHFINPRLFSKGSMRMGRWNALVRQYETLPKYNGGKL